MPRSYPGNAPALVADHDPTQEMQFDIGEVVKQLGGAMLGIVGDVFDSAIAFGQNIIDTLLGIATQPIEALRNWVENIPILSDIVGLIKKAASSVIPVSHIVDAVKNLLDNGNFKDPVSIAPGFGWVWDGTTGLDGGGSAKVTADGTVKELLSNLIDAQSGQKFDLSAFVKWAGITATAGTHIFIEAVAYLRGTEISSTPVGSIANISATVANWQPLNGPTWTVPSGADGVRIRLKVSDLVTAGSVWFTKANASKTGLMPMNFVSGLLGKFQDIINAIPNILGMVGDAFNLDDWAEALATLLPIGSFNDWLTKLTSAGNGGAGGSTGIPIWDNAIGMLGNLFGKAQKAQDAVSTVRDSVLITTAIPGGQVRRLPVPQTLNTDLSLTIPAPTNGYRISKVVVQAIGAAPGGPRPADGVREGAPGGLHGGIVTREFLGEEMPAGTVLTYRVGTGGAGYSDNQTGLGNPPNPTWVKRNGVILIQPIPGEATSRKLTDRLRNEGAPGNGGDGGSLLVNGITYNSGNDSYSETYGGQDGKQGGLSPAGSGGQPGRSAGGWFGSGDTSPSNGVDAITNDGLEQYGGSGGGGGRGVNAGLGGSQQMGARGGYPGGGSGATGAFRSASLGTTKVGSVTGADARVDVFIYEQEITS